MVEFPVPAGPLTAGEPLPDHRLFEPTMTITRLLRACAWALLLPLLFSHAHAQTDSATAELLMRKSGLWQMLGGMEPQLKAGVAQALAEQKTKPSAAEAERFERAAATAYAPERLRASGLAIFTRSADSRHLPVVQQWFDTATGREFTRLDELAIAQQTDPADVARRGGAVLQSMPPAQVALLQQIIVATDSADMMAGIMVNTLVAVHRGVDSMVPPSQTRVTEEQLRAALELQRPQLVEAFTGLSMASLALAYASVPAADLQLYLDFLRSDAGRHFNGMVGQAMDAAMSEAALDFGRRLPGTRDQSNT